MLTEDLIASAAPKDRPYKIGDSKGLYLFVTPAGAKSWRFKYRQGGKERRLTFGLYPSVSLADARIQRDAARLMIDANKDPLAVRAVQAQQQVEEFLAQFPPKADGVASVYFVRSADGLIKIGVSTNVASRLQTLRRIYGSLELMGTMTGGYAAEGVLHRLFSESAVGGEWFEPSQRLLEFIDEHAEIAACH